MGNRSDRAGAPITRRAWFRLAMCLGVLPLVISMCASMAGFGVVRRVTHSYGYPNADSRWSDALHAVGAIGHDPAQPLVTVGFVPKYPSLSGLLPYRTRVFGGPYSVGITLASGAGRYSRARCDGLEIRIGADGAWQRLTLDSTDMPVDSDGWSLLATVPGGTRANFVSFLGREQLRIEPGTRVWIRFSFRLQDSAGRERLISEESEALYERDEQTEIAFPHA